MFSVSIVLLLQVTGSLCIDNIFGPDKVVKRDGYMIGHKTINYESSSHSERFKRDKAGRYITDFKPQEITEIVDFHNFLRTRVNPSASNMEFMEWDEQLAHMAQQWADVCDFRHGQPQNISPYPIIGQNIFAGNGDPMYRSGVYATQKWYEEYRWYTYEDESCQPGEMCGHYTQVVWANSKTVGCGRQKCNRLRGYGDESNVVIIVCNYGPNGNFNGQKPYQVGPACTQCPADKPRCYKGLCHDCSLADAECECRLQCKNCGTLDAERCRCSCMDGWYGPDCSTPCEDTHEWCGANPGWPTADACYMASYVPRNCPKLCGLCNPASKGSKCASKDRKKLEILPSLSKRLKETTSNIKKAVSKVSKSSRPAYCSQVPYAVAMIDNELVMFKKGKMWRFSPTGRLFSDANGEHVQGNYRGLTNGFKSVYQRQTDNRIVFLKGADFYIFNGRTLESGPSKLKTLGLKGNPSAAFYHRGERKSYHFKGARVWRFDDRTQTLDAGFPKDVSLVFPGLPSKITGAYQNAAGDLIFLRGKSYYKIKRGKTRVRGGRKPFHKDMLEGC